MDSPDQLLLAVYVEDQSEEAFRQLVENYLSMVYHTALRRTGNPSLADDVSQQVFTILAKKAPRFHLRSGLGGWLHQTTLFEASKAMRSKSRRAAKMKELASQSSAPNETRTWNEAQPVLDESIESLPNNDRKTIILRFFEEQSFRAIGEALGKSEDASQKQVSRALDKLGLVLSRQGFAASTVALGTLLSSEATKAAPIALQHSVAQTNLAVVQHFTTTTLISNTLITMS
jgi:RNA polymerase sigma factor (sigma-70 family)